MKRLFTIMATAAMLFSGCQKGDNPTINSGDGEVKFTSGIATRASGTYWTVNDEIGVYMLQTGTTTAIVDASNVKYTNSVNSTTAVFSTTTPIYYPYSGNVDFRAYYPYKTTALTNYVYPLNVTNQASLPAIDLMTSDNLTNIARNNDTKNLTFNHKLSNIVLTIRAGAGLTGQDLSNLVVTLRGTKVEGTYNISSNAITLSGYAENITLNKTATNGTSAEGIIIPQRRIYSRNAELAFSLAGVIDAVAIFPVSEFEIGKKYTYTVTLNRTSAKLTSGTITNWGNGGSGDLDAQPEPDISRSSQVLN